MKESETETGCVCSSPGYCKKLDMHIGGRKFELCRNSKKMHDIFHGKSSEPTKKAIQDKTTSGLGDKVESALKRVGITQDRVKRFTGKKSCGCSKRKEKLNALGKWAKKSIGKTVEESRNLFSRITGVK